MRWEVFWLAIDEGVGSRKYVVTPSDQTVNWIHSRGVQGDKVIDLINIAGLFNSCDKGIAFESIIFPLRAGYRMNGQYSSVDMKSTLTNLMKLIVN